MYFQFGYFSFLKTAQLLFDLSGFLDSGHTRKSSREESKGGCASSFASVKLLSGVKVFTNSVCLTGRRTRTVPVASLLKTFLNMTLTSSAHPNPRQEKNSSGVTEKHFRCNWKTCPVSVNSSANRLLKFLLVICFWSAMFRINNC